MRTQMCRDANLCVTLRLMELKQIPEQRLGELLTRAREERGLSRRRAATLAGISEPRLRHIERGVQERGGKLTPVKTTPEKLVRIARVVGLEPIRVLTDAGYADDLAKQLLQSIEPTTKQSKPRGISRSINLDSYEDDEVEMIEAFLAELEAGRDR